MAFVDGENGENFMTEIFKFTQFIRSDTLKQVKDLNKLVMDDYEQKYKEALEIAKECLQDGTITTIARAYIWEIFPELKEPEDENKRISKEISQFLKQNNGWNNEWLTWLEKQSKKKPDDNVKPKFYECEWVTNGNHTWKILEIKPLDYILQSPDGNIVDDTISYVDEHFHLWTIKDVKDGDVLQLGTVTAIFKKYIGYGNCECYCSVYNGEFEIPSQVSAVYFYECYNAVPATKKQCDLLFRKMEEAGYEWNSEKKELKKIESKKLNADEVIEWLRNRSTSLFGPRLCKTMNIIKQFKKDFGL